MQINYIVACPVKMGILSPTMAMWLQSATARLTGVTSLNTAGYSDKLARPDFELTARERAVSRVGDIAVAVSKQPASNNALGVSLGN